MSEVVVLSKNELAEFAQQIALSAVKEYAQKFTVTPELMTIADLAEYLKCSPSAIRSRVKTEGLPNHKLGDSLRFYKSEIDWWLKNRNI